MYGNLHILYKYENIPFFLQEAKITLVWSEIYFLQYKFLSIGGEGGWERELLEVLKTQEV